MRLAVLAHLLLFLLVLSACTGSEKVTSSGPFQKRKYQKGWHVQLSDEGNKGGPSGPSVKLEEREWVGGDEEELSELPGIPDQLSEECDVIVKTDGERIEVKVHRIGTEKIEYKKCGREDGPTYEILRSDVKLIRYPDGEEDRFGSSQDDEEGKRGEEQESEDDDYYVDPEEREKEEDARYVDPEKQARQEESQGNDTLGVLGFVLSILAALGTLIGLGAVSTPIFLVGLGGSLIALFLSTSGNEGLSTAGTIISLINLGIGLLIFTILLIGILLTI